MSKGRKKYTRRSKGIEYYRLRWTDDNGKRRERNIPLPNDPDSAEYDREYWAIRSGTSEALKEPVRTSWRNLIASYKASRKFRSLKPGTVRKYNPVLNEILNQNADRDVRKVTRQQIRAMHEKYADTPRAADHRLQVVRILLNYAVRELEWIDKNPAEHIHLFGAQREFEPWPEDAQKAFKRACNSMGETNALTAFMLGTLTGQRASDVCKMEWSHYDGEYIAVAQEKTKERVWIYCPPALKAYLDALPRRGKHILAKNLTEPLGYDAIQRAFSRVRKAATACDGLVMHGWRYTAAVALAEAGASDAEIQSVTGHKTLAMVQKYRRQARQKQLSKQAQERRK
jgi:integrase